MSLIFKTVEHDPVHQTLTLAEPTTSSEIRVPAPLSAMSRSLFGVIPAMLKRTGKLVFEAVPAGCSLGPRPSGWYIEALRGFGVSAESQGGELLLRTGSHHPTKVAFARPSMTGSVVAIAMAAATEGRSVIANVSEETSVGDLLECAEQMGVGVGRSADGLVIEGRGTYRSARVDVKPDRIHAVTYLTAGLLTNGTVTVLAHSKLRLDPFARFLRAIGADFSYRDREFTVRPLPKGETLKPTRLTVGSEPLFSSDWAPFVVLLLAARSRGVSEIREEVFGNRFRFAEQLSAQGMTGVQLPREASAPAITVVHGEPGYG